FLYRTFPFSVSFEPWSLSMCGRTQAISRPMQKPDDRVPSPSGALPGVYMSGSHNLQDYHMQLLLLEQQNKRRQLLARQALDSVIPPRQSSSCASQYTSTWKPAISEACFRRIRSLRVEITL